MTKDIREQYEKEFKKWVKEGQPPVVVAWTLTEKILDSQKEEWVEVLKSEEFAQRCEWRYWYKKENNPDTNFAAGYERALNDIINQLESNHA